MMNTCKGSLALGPLGTKERLLSWRRGPETVSRFSRLMSQNGFSLSFMINESRKPSVSRFLAFDATRNQEKRNS
jgi:hypothetical protein